MVFLAAGSVVVASTILGIMAGGVVGWTTTTTASLEAFRSGKRYPSAGESMIHFDGSLVVLQARDTFDDEEELDKVPVPRRGRSRKGRSSDAQQESPYYEEEARSNDRYYDDEEEEDWEEDDDEEEDDQFDDLGVDYDLLSDVVIPNPLLDSIDPDGAAERFPELARDPRFWFDVVLFIAFINFLSDIGPRDPNFFPWDDFPWQTL